MNEQVMAMARDSSKIDQSKTPVEEFKAVIIRVPTGPNKSMIEISETFMTDLKKSFRTISNALII